MKMKCAFCGEEIQGDSYKIKNDARISGIKPNAMHPVTLIKDMGDVCSKKEKPLSSSFID
jgi:hypothetical protein